MNDRRSSQSNDVVSFGPFSLFAAERLLKKAGEPIPLGGRALDILIALAQRAGQVVTHKELISTVWPDVTVEESNLRFQMATLRKALGDGRDGARYVSNVAGRGYCFVAPVARSSPKQPVPVTGITTTERVQKLPPRPGRMVGRDDTIRALAEQLQILRFACTDQESRLGNLRADCRTRSFSCGLRSSGGLFHRDFPYKCEVLRSFNRISNWFGIWRRTGTTDCDCAASALRRRNLAYLPLRDRARRPGCHLPYNSGRARKDV